MEQYSKELGSLLCEKLGVSAASVHCIIDVCSFSGWYAANGKAGHESDAKDDEDKVGAWWLQLHQQLSCTSCDREQSSNNAQQKGPYDT